jgi:diguanylate cyclase (GGDEF)-like protein
LHRWLANKVGAARWPWTPPYVAHEPRFDADADRRYRAWYRHYVRARIRMSIWLPMCTIALLLFAPGIFAEFRTAWFGVNYPAWLDALRFGVALPALVAVAVVSYTDLYARYYAPVVQVVALADVLCASLFDLAMRTQGYSITTWILLLVLASYFLYGMRVVQGLRLALGTLGIYMAVGMLGGINSPQWRLDLAAMVFATVFSGFVFYAMHRTLKRNYAERMRISARADRDPLTSLYNRRMFDEHLTTMWQQASRAQVTLGLVLIDIDHFKNYNDNLGHQAGDECLMRIAAILAAAARRPLDIAARFGGDEFAVLLYAADRRGVEELCAQLRQDIAAVGLTHPQSGAAMTVSIGAACVQPREGRSYLGCVQLADEALYAAKANGRNRAVVMDREYETLQTGVFRRYRAA